MALLTENLSTTIQDGNPGHAAGHNSTNQVIKNIVLKFNEKIGDTADTLPAVATLVSQLQAKLSAIQLVIGDGTNDINSVISNVTELLAVFTDYQEGLSVAQQLASKQTASQVNALIDSAKYTASQIKTLYESVITYDSAPTVASTNLLKSGAVASALSSKANADLSNVTGTVPASSLPTRSIQYYTAGANDAQGNPTFVINAADKQTLANDLSPYLPASGASDKTSRKIFNILDYYTDYASTTDDAAFAACVTACVADQGIMHLRTRPGKSSIVLTQPQTIRPADTKSEIEFSIEAFNSPISWKGVSGTATAPMEILKIIGVRRSKFTRLRVLAPSDSTITNLALVSLDTANASGTTGSVNQNSTTNLTFDTCDFYAGKGVNNVCMLLGNVSGGGGDISQIVYLNCGFTGGADNGLGQHTGAQNAIAGQKGIWVKGRNTLNITLNTGIFSYLEKGYSNEGGGNGAISMTNMVWSHCAYDCYINSVQNYTFVNCRSEDSIRALFVTDSVDSPQIMYTNCIWDNLVTSSGNAFRVGRPGVLTIIGGAMNNSYTSYDARLIQCNNYDAGPGGNVLQKGLLQMRGVQIQGAAATPFFTIEGDNETPSAPRWRVEVKNCPAISATNRIIGYYSNRDTQ